MIVAQEDRALRHGLLGRIADARRRSDALFQAIKPDALYQRPIAERHRFVFYVGHLEAFDWNLLNEAIGVKSEHSGELDRLFAFGIDPVGGGLPTDQPSDWPSREIVNEYVGRGRSAIDKALERDDGGDSLDLLLNVAIEHRLMHLETLAYMLHQLPLEKKNRQGSARFPESAAPEFRMVDIPAGRAVLGLSRNSETFGWDNEFEKHNVQVPAFEIDRYMVTNGQFLDFLNAGGYETHSLWSDEDWEWRTEQGISQPVFWKNAGGRWMYRGMFDETPLPLDWPVYVSHAEASAYARWAGKALPTEEHWHRAAYGTAQADERIYPWGADRPAAGLGNFDFERWDPVPVNAFPAGRSAFGVEGMLGNGWEWTSTKFGPFPGFEAFPFYQGYSANFFDGKHFVIKGGSARTAACMLRPSFRNWFQPHYQYVYAGFRCVNS
jgi:gamma-glutamyl hercynylcysteine S-oxide synthase